MTTVSQISKPARVNDITMWVIFNEDGQNKIFSTRDLATMYRRNNDDTWTYPERYTGSIRRAV
jgi:hypothetical protein